MLRNVLFTNTSTLWSSHANRVYRLTLEALSCSLLYQGKFIQATDQASVTLGRLSNTLVINIKSKNISIEST